MRPNLLVKIVFHTQKARIPPSNRNTGTKELLSILIFRHLLSPIVGSVLFPIGRPVRLVPLEFSCAGACLRCSLDNTFRVRQCRPAAYPVIITIVELKQTSAADPAGNMTSMVKQRKRPSPLLGALRAVLAYPGSHLKVVFAVQALTAFVALPLATLLFRWTLAWAGITTLTDANLFQLGTSPKGLLGGLLLLTFLSVWWLFEQTVLLFWFRHLRNGTVPTLKTSTEAIKRMLIKRFRPSVLLLVPYAFLLVPLGSLGVATFLSRGIRLPEFIAYELTKKPFMGAVLLAVSAVAVYVNLRLSLVAYYLVNQTSLPIPKTFSRSWKQTRPHQLQLLFAYVVTIGLGAAALRFSVDLVINAVESLESRNIGLAPVAAALGATSVQLITLITAGFVMAVLLEVFVDVAGAPEAVYPPKELPVVSKPVRWLERTAGVGLVLIFVTATTVYALDFFEEPWDGSTQIAAHRGYTAEAVENTLESLQAAKEAGADMVELDVQQTLDGELIVFHDATLGRLAGDPRAISDMTLEEVKKVTLSQGSDTGTIPTFQEFVEEASVLDIPLLVEIKGVGTQADFVADIGQTLQDSPIADRSAIQTFSRFSVEELKETFPDLRVGWLSAFQRGRFDTAGADFVSVEQGSYTRSALDDAHAHGAQVYLWTVTDSAKARQYIRDGVDGIITSDITASVASKEALLGEPGLALRLQDELNRVISWW